MKNKITPFQFFLLSFALLCAGMLLSPVSLCFGDALIISVFGILFFFLLPFLNFRSTAVKIPLFLLSLFLFAQNTVRFGLFCREYCIPTLPVWCSAGILLLLTAYGGFLGLRACGRFAQVCVFLLPFFLLLLIRGANAGAETEYVATVTGGAIGFLSIYGEGILLPVFFSDVIPASSPVASAFAKADRSVSEETLPGILNRVSPLRFPLLCASVCLAAVCLLLSIGNGNDFSMFPSVSSLIMQNGDEYVPLALLCLLPLMLLRSFLLFFAIKRTGSLS